MAQNIVSDLAKELERLLPLVQALADVEVKGTAAQKLLKDTEARQARAEQDALNARQSADAALIQIRQELEEKTASYKAEMVARHTALSSEYEALKIESKAARSREQEALRAAKDLLRDMQTECARAQQELDEVRSRLENARQEFKKALTVAAA